MISPGQQRLGLGYPRAICTSCRQSGIDRIPCAYGQTLCEVCYDRGHRDHEDVWGWGLLPPIRLEQLSDRIDASDLGKNT